MALTNLSQITTSGIATGTDLNIRNITGAAATFTGNVTVGGTLTYDDVTNIDSVGLITARSGINVNSGDVNITSGNLALASATPMVVASNGSGHLRLGAGGSEKVRIKSNGYVGLGTVTPRSKLDIHGSDAELRFYRDAGDRFGGLRYTGSLFKLRLPAADHFAIDDASNNERFRIKSDGKIGINEASPDSLLHLTNNAGAGIRAGLRLENSGTNNSPNDTMGEILFAHNDSNDAGVSASIVCKAEDAAGNTYIQINNGKPSALVEHLRITSDGKMGLGTNSPAFLAHIHNSGTGAGDHSYLQFTTGDTGATGSDGLTIGVGANETAYINFRESGPLVLSTSGTERLRISNSGNIGIATDNPNTKLQIVTTSGARALTLTAPTLGPYMVFETNSTPFADIGSEAGLTGSGSNVDMLTLNARGSRSLSFRTNSTERLRITSDGNIGVNKTTPKEWYSTYKTLQIYDAAYIAGSSDDSFVAMGANNYLDTGGTYDYTNTDYASQLYQVDGQLVFRNAPSGTADTAITWTERFKVISDGTVGINNASPDTTYKLDVAGAGQFTTSTTNQQNDFNTGQLTVRNNQAAQGAFIDFRADSNNGTQGVIAKIGGFNTFNGTGYDGLLTFSTRKSAGNTMIERLRITKDGYIGINQTSPNAPLSFNTGVGQKIELYNSGSGNEFGIGVQSSELRISSGTNSVITFYTNGYGGNERLRIDSDGTLLVNSAIDNTSSHGVIVAHAPASNADTGYKSIEIGNSNGSGSNRGSTICGQPKSNSHPPYTLIGCWDTGTQADVYYGGGWGSNMRPATQHRFYTNSTYPTANGSGTERIRIAPGGWLNIGGNFEQSSYTAQVTRIGGETDVVQIKGNVGNAFIRFTDNDASSDFTLGSDDAVGSGGFILYDRNDSAYRVVVDTNGRVSINATSPAQIGGQTPYLYVASGYANLDGLRIRGLDTGNTIWKTGGDMSLTVSSNHAINLKTQSTTRLIITGDGGIIKGSTNASNSQQPVQLFFNKRGSQIGKRIHHGSGSTSTTHNLLTISSWQSSNTRLFAYVTVHYVNPVSNFGGRMETYAAANYGGTRAVGTFAVADGGRWGNPSGTLSLSWSTNTLQLNTFNNAYMEYSVDITYVAYDGAVVAFS